MQEVLSPVLVSNRRHLNHSFWTFDHLKTETSKGFLTVEAISKIGPNFKTEFKTNFKKKQISKNKNFQLLTQKKSEKNFNSIIISVSKNIYIPSTSYNQAHFLISTIHTHRIILKIF